MVAKNPHICPEIRSSTVGNRTKWHIGPESSRLEPYRLKIRPISSVLAMFSVYLLRLDVYLVLYAMVLMLYGCVFRFLMPI